MMKRVIKKKLGKQAIIFNPDVKKNDHSINGSWFGLVTLALPEEDWPVSCGRPMIPLLQLNLQGLPEKPDILKNVALLTLFIDQENLPMDTPNGENWLLRTYNSMNNLKAIEAPDVNSRVKSLALLPEIISEDYPCYEDWPMDIPLEWMSSLNDEFPNKEGIKVGGWPTLIQSEIYWHPHNPCKTKPEYVLQIDSIEEANWYWGDYGIAYIGKGSHSASKNEWLLSWQCH